ncbi:MAG: RNase adaptor protein RapZ, partial [Clostridia bacterium]|nr:RNase adaptor protein RapZ [Clostridia bacterium]
PNPFYVDELKDKTGNDTEVRDYVMNTKAPKEFMNKLTDMIKFLLPLYIEEGKSSLTIGIGCTGGKHRSVTMANELSQAIENYNKNLIHRDILRGK